MSRVPHKDSKQELLVAKFLYSNGYRYRKNYKLLPGRPDLAITKLKVSIFIHGCFWHGHSGCKYSRIPDTNKEYWENKIKENQKRDISVIKRIEELKWESIIIWQCELRNKLNQDIVLKNLLLHLKRIKDGSL